MITPIFQIIWKTKFGESNEEKSDYISYTPLREGHEVADSLLPSDIKGLTKQQLKDLKEGKGSPKDLNEKYAKLQHLSQLKSKYVKKHTVEESDDSILSFGIDPGRSIIKESLESPPNKASPRFGGIHDPSILDGSSTKSPSLSHVLNYVNSLKVGKAESSVVDCVIHKEEENERIFNHPRNGNWDFLCPKGIVSEEKVLTLSLSLSESAGKAS